ncbi:MAG: hypothetical protein KIT85_13840 [Pseudolabrys sp.]|nr:hypothetical protein [Pseudolabrys sp.]
MIARELRSHDLTGFGFLISITSYFASRAQGSKKTHGPVRNGSRNIRPSIAMGNAIPPLCAAVAIIDIDATAFIQGGST